MNLTLLKSKSNTRFVKNLLLSIKNNKKILIFISVLQALGIPVIAAIGMLEVANKIDHYDISASLVMISLFCLGIAVLCGIFIALKNFSYLYKKSQTDMVYALPIKRTTKFTSDFLAGLGIYVIPYIAACIIGDLIFVFGSLDLIDRGKEFISRVTPLLLQLEFAGLLAMIMLYTLSVLVLCCCGAMLESIMNIFMINAVIPGAIAVIAVLFFANLYGVPTFETILPILGYTSPIGALIYGIYLLDNMEYHYYDNVDMSCINGTAYGKWVVFFLLCTAAYFLLSLFLYKKRKAEHVSKPYVYKLLYYVLVTVIIMAIYIITKFEDDLVIPVIIFAFIVYMIFEVITNRGFKKIYMSLIRFAATSVGILVLSAIANSTHGFGIEGMTYSPSLIKSVGVSYSGIDDVMNISDNEVYKYYLDLNSFSDLIYSDTNAIEYKDKEIIKRMIDIQKQAIDTFRSGKYETYKDIDGPDYYYEYGDDIYDFPSYHVQFRFNLVSGTTAVRNYTLNMEQLMQLAILDSTEEMADYQAERLMNEITHKLWNGNGNEYKKEYVLSCPPIKNLYNYYNTNITKELTYEEAEELANCYRSDYLKATSGEFKTSKIVCFIGESGSIPIRECFTDTLDFLKKHGCEDVISGNALQRLNVTGELYSPDGYKSWGRDDITASFGNIKTTISCHQLDTAQTRELLKYATSYHIENNDCYVMDINGIFYVIPYAYTDFAKKIYDESPVRNNHEDYYYDYSDDEYVEDDYYYDDGYVESEVLFP